MIKKNEPRWDDHLADSIIFFVFAYLIFPWSTVGMIVLTGLGVLFLGVPLENLTRKR